MSHISKMIERLSGGGGHTYKDPDTGACTTTHVHRDIFTQEHIQTHMEGLSPCPPLPQI